jgi:hypothetical protein
VVVACGGGESTSKEIVGVVRGRLAVLWEKLRSFEFKVQLGYTLAVRWLRNACFRSREPRFASGAGSPCPSHPPIGHTPQKVGAGSMCVGVPAVCGAMGSSELGKGHLDGSLVDLLRDHELGVLHAWHRAFDRHSPGCGARNISARRGIVRAPHTIATCATGLGGGRRTHSPRRDMVIRAPLWR